MFFFLLRICISSSYGNSIKNKLLDDDELFMKTLPDHSNISVVW